MYFKITKKKSDYGQFFQPLNSAALIQINTTISWQKYFKPSINNVTKIHSFKTVIYLLDFTLKILNFSTCHHHH